MICYRLDVNNRRDDMSNAATDQFTVNLTLSRADLDAILAAGSVALSEYGKTLEKVAGPSALRAHIEIAEANLQTTLRRLAEAAKQ